MYMPPSACSTVPLFNMLPPLVEQDDFPQYLRVRRLCVALQVHPRGGLAGNVTHWRSRTRVNDALYNLHSCPRRDCI